MGRFLGQQTDAVRTLCTSTPILPNRWRQDKHHSTSEWKQRHFLLYKSNSELMALERERERILILIKIPLERSRFWGCTLYMFVFRSGWLDLYLQSQKSRMYNMDDSVLFSLSLLPPLNIISQVFVNTKHLHTCVCND